MRRILLIVLAVLLVLVAAAAAVPFLVPSSTIARYAADAVREQTGRELVIDGPIERAILPSVRVATGPVTLSNADWAEDETMVSLESFEVSVKFWPLLAGDVEIETLRLVRPVANLERRADGAENWVFGDDSADADDAVEDFSGDGPDDRLVSLALAEIVDGAVRFADRVGGQTMIVEAINATGDLPGLDAPLTLVGSAVWNGAPVALDARIATPAALQDGRPVDAALSLSAPGLEVSFEGAATAPSEGGAPTARGRFDAALSGDLEETAWLRASAPPELETLGALSLAGEIDASETGLSLDVSGDATLSDRLTAVALKASADAGWETGASPVAVDASARNDVLDAGYVGTVAAVEDGPPRAAGAYRLRAEDAQALLDWVSVIAGRDLAAEAPQLAALASVDLAGEIDFGDAAAASLAGDIRYNDRDLALSADLAGGADWSVGGAVETALAIRSPELLRVEWSGTTALPETGPEAVGSYVLRINDAQEALAWASSIAGRDIAAEIDALALLDFVNLSGDVDVGDAVAGTLSGALGYDDRRIAVNGDVAAGADWRDGGAIQSNFTARSEDFLRIEWAGTTATPATGPVASGAYVVRLDDAQTALALASAVAGQDFAAGAPQLAQLESVNLKGEVDLADAVAATLDGAVGFNGRRTTVSATVSGGADWRDGGVIDTTLALKAGRLLDLAWTGTVASPEDGPTAAGRLELASERLRGLVDWAGIGPIEAPARTFRSMRAALDAEMSPTRIVAVIDAATLDDTSASGRVAADLAGAVPAIDLTLETGPLDLRPFTAGARRGGGGGGGGGGQTGWSDAPLDLSALRGVDATFDILADAVTTDTVKLGRSRIEGALQNGRLALTVEELGLYGGGAKGAATIDASGEAARVDANIDASAVQMLPFLRDVAEFGFLEGLGRMRLDVSGGGGSMASLMRSLDGDGEIRFEDGAIFGVNLAAMVRNLGPGFFTAGDETRKTDFTELFGTFTIEDGVLSNLDLTMLGPLVRLAGEGRIDLAAQTLDYRLTPRAVASLTGQGGAADTAGLAFPVLVSGSWSNPSFRPDLGAAIGGVLTDPGGAVDGVRGLIEGAGGGGVGGVLQGLTGGGGGAESGDGDEGRPTPSPTEAIRSLFGD